MTRIVVAAPLPLASLLERASASTRRLLGNIASGFLIRALNLISTLLILPMAVQGLGTADYAILATVLSAVVLFAFADLGLGLAVVNPVSGWTTDLDAAQSAVRRVFWTLCGVSALAAVGGVGWIVAIVSADTGSPMDSPRLSLAAALVCTGLGLPTGIAQRVMFGLQQGVTAGLWIGAGRLASLGAVALAFHQQAGLLVYVLAIVGLPVLVGWLNLAWLFAHSRTDLSPFRGTGRPWPRRSDITDGLSFLILQLAVFAEFGVDNLLIAATRGTAEIAHYDILSKLFGYLPALITIGAFPLWPALRRARSDGDERRVRRLGRWAYGLTIAICLGVGVPLALFHGVIVKHWIGVDFPPDYPLAGAWTVFVLMTCVATIQAMQLNAAGLISQQARIMLAFVPVLLVTKGLLLQTSALAMLPLATAILIAVRMIVLHVASMRPETAHA